MNKFLELLSSRRFWLILIFGTAFLLDQLGIIPGAYAKATEIVTGFIATIGTVDKFSQG